MPNTVPSPKTNFPYRPQTFHSVKSTKHICIDESVSTDCLELYPKLILSTKDKDYTTQNVYVTADSIDGFGRSDGVRCARDEHMPYQLQNESGTMNKISSTKRRLSSDDRRVGGWMSSRALEFSREDLHLRLLRRICLLECWRSSPSSPIENNVEEEQEEHAREAARLWSQA